MTLTQSEPVAGEVAPGFEPVLEFFSQGVHDFGAGGGAFSVYAGGQKVVDLWGGNARAGEPWRADTMATLMSTTKGLTALCAQVLHGRGLLDVEAPMVEYWPEFGYAGKQKATVRQALDHTIGVLGLPRPEDLLDWEGRGWDDYDAIADQLASAEPAWEPGTRIGYHAISYGWLVGELVRRITGDTIGNLLRTAVADVVDVDVWIGTPVAEQHRVAEIVPESHEGIPSEVIEVDRLVRQAFNEPGSFLATAAVSMYGSCITENLDGFMNSARGRSVEIAAANGSAGARDLARIYGALANGGELDGQRLVADESLTLFSKVSAAGTSAITPPLQLPDGTVVPPPYTCYALGYASNEPEPGGVPVFGPNPETYGHAGHGGQLGFCDPVAGLGFGFVRTHLSLSPHFASGLVQTVYDCWDTLQG